MDITALLIFLAIGAVAGWLAGQIFQGIGFGLLGNIVVGVIGAIVGGYLFGSLIPSLGVPYLREIISAVLGALIVLFILRLIKRA